MNPNNQSAGDKVYQTTVPLMAMPVQSKDEGTKVKHSLPAPEVPFISPIQTFSFDSSGAEFTGFEVTVRIPPEAVSTGFVAHLELGLTLYGPFSFGTDKICAPVSPILWLCLKEDVILNKPIEVILPHFLSNVSQADISSLPQFAIANHAITDVGGQNRYHFKPLDHESTACFFSCKGKNFASVQIKHFCYLCLLQYTIF